MTPQTASELSKRRGEIVIKRFGTDTQFKQKVNPSVQSFFAEKPEKAIMGDYPTLRDINVAYGKGFAVEWLLQHITNLALFCGVKNPTTEQMEELARVIAVEYHYLKITEILLFFHRFKTGRYGRFFGAVDPMVITCALRDFIKERNEEYFQYEKK